jgi:hypothetical protein
MPRFSLSFIKVDLSHNRRLKLQKVTYYVKKTHTNLNIRSKSIPIEDYGLNMMKISTIHGSLVVLRQDGGE